MKPINLPHVNLPMTVSSKALIVAAAAILAACSRNPQPGTDETGRADTTVAADTVMRADTGAIKTQIDTAARTDTATQVTPMPGTDTSRVGRDSVLPQMPSNADTTVSRNNNVWTDSTVSDSAKVPHSAGKSEGDSALIHRNVPDSVGR